MKNYVIKSGTVTPEGNLSGYTSKGERVHVYARQLVAAGLVLEPGDSIKDPIYAIATVKHYENVDANNDPIPGDKGFDRLTALSIFKTKTELVNAHAEEMLLDLEIGNEVAKQASAAGLTSDQLAKLVESAATI